METSFFKKLFFPNILRHKRFPKPQKSLAQWQENSFTFIFRTICIASLPTIINSDIKSANEGLWLNFAAYNLSYLICVIVAFFTAIPFKIRARTGLFIFLSLGVLSIVSIGPLGSGRTWLYTATIFTTLILGMRMGILVLLAQSILLVACYHLVKTQSDLWTRLAIHSPDAWITTSLTLIFLSLISVVAMGRLIKGISSSLEESETVRGQLQETTRQLEQKVLQHDQTIQSLQESEERWHFALEGAGDGVWDWDVEQGKVFFSPQWRKIFGFQENKNKGTINEWFDRILPEGKERFDKALGPLFEGTAETFRAPHQIQADGGTVKWLFARGKVIKKDSQGKPARIIGTHTDITAMKTLEAKQKNYESRLQQSQKLEAIGTLAGGIAHDFNNILFPILGHTELLLEDIKDDETTTRHSLDQIHLSAMRAKELVQQILTFSRQEETIYLPIELQPIIKETIKLLRSTIPTWIEIKETIDPSCTKVLADATQVHQIIMNLATNAYHAIGDSSGTLNIRLSECSIADVEAKHLAVEPGRFICLSVSDTGSGINPAYLKKIFDPFFTSKTKEKGTGMGLAVVHGIVKKMKGSINVYSELGQGSEFKVYLPVADQSDPTAAPEETLKEPLIITGTEHILLIDDEQAILSMEKKALERLSYQVTTITSPVDALDLFRRTPERFDMVITDMSMPKMNGNNLAAELLAVRPDIPIIICTGFSEKTSIETARKTGIRNIVTKPVLISDLALKIRAVFDETS